MGDFRQVALHRLVEALLGVAGGGVGAAPPPGGAERGGARPTPRPAPPAGGGAGRGAPPPSPPPPPPGPPPPPASNSRQFSPSLRYPAAPPRPVATTGRPRAIASSGTSPHGSFQIAGKRTASASA